MPATEEDAQVQAQAQMDAASEERAGAIGDTVPPAKEPLQPSNVNSLGEIAASAVEQLSGGQAPALAVQPIEEPVDALPQDVARIVFTFGAFFNSPQAPPEAEPYKFNPVELATTNAGLDEMQGLIANAGRDPKLQKAMTKPIGKAPPKAEPKKKTVEEMADEFMDEEV